MPQWQFPRLAGDLLQASPRSSAPQPVCSLCICITFCGVLATICRWLLGHRALAHYRKSSFYALPGVLGLRHDGSATAEDTYDSNNTYCVTTLRFFVRKCAGAKDSASPSKAKVFRCAPRMRVSYSCSYKMLHIFLLVCFASSGELLLRVWCVSGLKR